MTLTARRPRALDRGELVEAGAAVETAARSQPRQARRVYLLLNGASLVVVAAIALGIIGILYLIQTSQVAQAGYQLSHLQTQEDQLTNANEKLRYQVDHDHSLPVVQQVAIAKLGMVPLHTFMFLQVDRPAQDQLPPLGPEHRAHVSLWARVREALLGSNRADHVDTPPPAHDGAQP